MRHAAWGRCLPALIWIAIVSISGFAGAADDDIPGQFDYYLFSLSWSPQYCRSLGKQAPVRQCGRNRHYGFVIHGLWPQYAAGWPEYCSALPSNVPQEIVARMLPIMPSGSLIEHEWDRHGSCSGLSVSDYFQASETLYRSVRFPRWMPKSSSIRQVTRHKLVRDLLNANPELSAESIVFSCQGNRLSEIRLCYDKTLRPTFCDSDVIAKQCGRDRLGIVPIR